MAATVMAYLGRRLSRENTVAVSPERRPHVACSLCAGFPGYTFGDADSFFIQFHSRDADAAGHVAKTLREFQVLFPLSAIGVWRKSFELSGPLTVISRRKWHSSFRLIGCACVKWVKPGD